MWLQVVSERKLHLRRQAAPEGGRVLLRSDVHLRTCLRVPAELQLPGDADRLTSAGGRRPPDVRPADADRLLTSARRTRTA